MISYKTKPLLLILLVAFIANCSPPQRTSTASIVKEINLRQGKWKKAVFAGGCFWCMQPPFDAINGVKKTTVGYAGGIEANPKYHQVSSGQTGHAEAILVEYDETIINYAKLVEVFWHNINPTQKNGQFHDIGHHYRTVIFYLSEKQHRVAKKSKKSLINSKKFSHEIATEISPLTKFWVAEEYHQKYYIKEPKHYNSYKVGSGRASYLKKTWKEKAK